MSILTPQIKSHRAMAEALRETAGQTDDPLIAAVLGGMATAHEVALDALEAGERELTNRIDGAPATVHYDPKGKPPPGASER